MAPRRTFRKKPTFAKKSRNGTKKLAKQVHKLMRENQPELKNTDNTVTGSTPTWSGLITSGNTIAQGSAVDQRIGDSVRMKGFNLKMQIVNNAATTTMTRVIVYWDQDNSVSSASQVLVNLGTAITPLSPYNRDYRDYFQVLHDKIYTTDSVSKGQVVLNINRKFNKIQHYAKGLSTPLKGELRILCISDVLSAPPSVDIYLRQYFIDM